MQNNTYFSGVQHCTVFNQFVMNGSSQRAANMQAVSKICLLSHHQMSATMYLQHVSP